jgi:hypothetical protein
MSSTINTESNAKDALSKAFSWVTDVAKDISTLDVTTLTGTITYKGVDATKIYDNIKELAGTGELRVVAMTHKDVDHDTVLFVSEGLPESASALLKAHDAAFVAAENARLAFLKFAAGIVGMQLP